MARTASDRWFPAAAVALVLLGLLWTVWLWPVPISDFELYWDEAGGSAAYERGGASVLLFALARLGFPLPQWAALAVNLPAALLLLWLLVRCDPTRSRLFAGLGALYLLLITPYFGIVQVDLSATALLGLAWALLLRPPPVRPARNIALGVAFGLAAVSARPQFALILTVLAGLLVVLALLERDGSRRLRALALPGLLAIVVATGFSLDLLARQAAGTGERVRTSSAVTLYSGLFVSDSVPPWCGAWTPAAMQAAYDDRERPLSDVAATRLASKPLRHWLAVVRCKFVHHILLPNAFALYWAVEPLREPAAAAPDPDRLRRLGTVERLRPWESLFFHVVVLAIYVAAIVATGRGWRRRRAEALLPLAGAVVLARAPRLRSAGPLFSRYHRPSAAAVRIDARPGRRAGRRNRRSRIAGSRFLTKEGLSRRSRAA